MKNKNATALINLRWNKPEWKDPKKRTEWGKFLNKKKKEKQLLRKKLYETHLANRKKKS